MKLCTNCGAENHKTATYCITCGLPLTDKYTPLEQITGGGKVRVVVLMAVAIAIAGVAAALFLVTGVNQNKMPGTTIEISQKENSIPADEPDDGYMSGKPQQKLKNVTSTGKYAVDDTTLDRISGIISHFIRKNNKEDVERVLNCFEYPVSRYYDNYNVTRSKLNTILQHKLVNELEFHKLKPDLSKGTVSFNGSIYVITFNATYEWATLEKPDDENTKKVRLKCMMNKNFKLTSVYEL